MLGQEKVFPDAIKSALLLLYQDTQLRAGEVFVSYLLSVQALGWLFGWSRRKMLNQVLWAQVAISRRAKNFQNYGREWPSGINTPGEAVQGSSGYQHAVIFQAGCWASLSN